MKDQEKTPKCAIRKGVRHRHLPLLGLCVESPLIFITKKKKKYTHTQGTYLNKTTSHNLNELQFDKMKFKWLYFLDYNIVEKLQSFVS